MKKFKLKENAIELFDRGDLVVAISNSGINEISLIGKPPLALVLKKRSTVLGHFIYTPRRLQYHRMYESHECHPQRTRFDDDVIRLINISDIIEAN